MGLVPLGGCYPTGYALSARWGIFLQRGNGMCRNIVARKVSVVVVEGVELDDRMEKVFEAAGDLIFEATRELINNYANQGLTWDFAAAAVGKALVVNGVSAMASAMGNSDVPQITSLCDDVNEIIACRLEEIVSEAA